MVRVGVPALSSFMGEDEEVTSVFNIFFEIFYFGGSEVLSGCGEDEEVGLFDFIEVDGIFVESDLGVAYFTL